MVLARRLLPVLLVLAGLSGLAGCESVKKVTSVFSSDVADPPPSPYPRDLQFDDIPVPQGMEHVRAKSFAYQHGPTRSANLVYVGDVSAEDVADFYRNEMPRYEWELGMVLGSRYDRTLKLTKGVEMCEISVRLIQTRTHLSIRVGHK